MVILTAIAVYSCVGLCFAVPFVVAGSGKLDPVAQHTPWVVRLIWLPGAAALWPVLLVKWMKGGAQ